MLLSKISAILLTCFFSLPLQALASIPSFQKGDVEIHFHDGAIVSGDTVVLGDVATIYARSIQDFEKLSGLILGSFPTDKTNLRIPARYVQSRVEEAVGSLHNVKINIPEFVEFKHANPQISAEEMAGRIYKLCLEQNKIPEGIEAKVEVSSMPSGIAANDYKISAAGERGQWRGEQVFRIESANGQSGWAKAMISWRAKAWVAKKEIKFQQDLNVEDFEQKTIDITHSLETPLLAADTNELTKYLTGSRSKRSLRATAFLTESMLDRRPDLTAGQALKVVFVADSGLRVMADGAALNDAIVGSIAKARLKKSKKIVSGRLVNGSLLEVNL